jgi:phosphoribosylformimino-5-aminoimidazole carboxamide ribotide isomerase
VRPGGGAGVILYPAIDILEGNAVRLVKGDFDVKRVYDEDPLAAARVWTEAGAQYLHVVDLDGAKTGAPVNLEHLRRIADQLGVPVQYGGGLRSDAAIAAAFGAGAQRVILGTAIFTDPELLYRAIETHGRENVLVSIDARGGYVATHGWLEATQVPAREAIERWSEGKGGVKRFVFTNIDHDGMLDGVNREEVATMTRAVGDGQLILSGGIGTIDDLQAVAALRAEQQLDGLDGVIVGKALYEQRFTIAEAQAALAG